MAIQCRTIPTLTPQDESRFWAKVDKSRPGGCWLWTGARDKNGYGRFQVDGQARCAHRIAYRLLVGPIPANHLICHTCDNPPCINPAHLFPGTVRENALDAKAKGRLATGNRHWSHTHPERKATGERSGARTHPECVPRGERCGMAKLTNEKVGQIRAMYGTGQHSLSSIALIFGHNKGHIGKIIRRELWKHIV